MIQDLDKMTRIIETFSKEEHIQILKIIMEKDIYDSWSYLVKLTRSIAYNNKTKTVSFIVIFLLNDFINKIIVDISSNLKINKYKK